MGWAERARLGEQLAPRADEPAVRRQLLGLLLDAEDTGVTFRTACALLARHDRIGVELVVTAATTAVGNTEQWLFDAVVSYRADALGDRDEFLRSTLSTFAHDGDSAMREAASQLLADLRLDQA